MTLADVIPVAIRPEARAAWPFLPASSVPGAVFVGPTGEVVRVVAGGEVERVILGGRPHGGAAELPTATARRAL